MRLYADQIRHDMREREGDRERGREGGREGGKEKGAREGESEGGRERGRDGGLDALRQVPLRFDEDSRHCYANTAESESKSCPYLFMVLAAGPPEVRRGPGPLHRRAGGPHPRQQVRRHTCGNRCIIGSGCTHRIHRRAAGGEGRGGRQKARPRQVPAAFRPVPFRAGRVPGPCSRGLAESPGVFRVAKRRVFVSAPPSARLRSAASW